MSILDTHLQILLFNQKRVNKGCLTWRYFKTNHDIHLILKLIMINMLEIWLQLFKTIDKIFFIFLEAFLNKI